LLGEVYQRIHAASSRWVLIGEYYNPCPVSVPYRGHMDRLFKRDFAGEMLDMFSDLRLVDYGFCYRRDAAFPQDDISWFLLGKER
jgi:pseudaminic acid biosynthesis-associated methylase